MVLDLLMYLYVNKCVYKLLFVCEWYVLVDLN